MNTPKNVRSFKYCHRLQESNWQREAHPDHPVTHFATSYCDYTQIIRSTVYNPRRYGFTKQGFKVQNISQRGQQNCREFTNFCFFR